MPLKIPQQQYHSQNPYPATVIPPEVDFRLAQKLQDEEYVQWIENNQPQDSTHHRAGESSVGFCNPSAPPLPPIPENLQYNHYPSYQNNLSHCHHHQSVVYASPNQPPLPYTQSAPYANGGGGSCTGGNNTYYGSLNQGYYPSTQSHPFYHTQVPHQHVMYRSVEEEDNSSSCLTGLYEKFISIILIFAVISFASMSPLLLSCAIAVQFSRIKECVVPETSHNLTSNAQWLL
ncbi:4063_t:CDS:2 [Acaulospora morrowiae]|uniref:4063_t:CDS:1 n=1 Tax=Acaulospora morrowiae TaxID=94023 RepID=A0A9N8ZWB6_9GLOM|nr:4063_t:CDS:2 [Acaulospora morrowiae]